MLKWVLSCFIAGVYDTVSIGSRVKTKYGWGTVTSGNLTVCLDDVPPPALMHGDQQANYHWTFNIGKEI